MERGRFLLQSLRGEPRWSAGRRAAPPIAPLACAEGGAAAAPQAPSGVTRTLKKLCAPRRSASLTWGGCWESLLQNSGAQHRENGFSLSGEQQSEAWTRGAYLAGTPPVVASIWPPDQAPAVTKHAARTRGEARDLTARSQSAGVQSLSTSSHRRCGSRWHRRFRR
jgi:hypothetical protein